MITGRILPPAEWARLDGVPLLHAIAPTLTPDRSVVIVVERDGVIIATTLLEPVWHLEAAWIAEADRGNVAVGRRLLRAILDALRAQDIEEVVTMSVDPEALPLGARLGPSVRLHGAHYAVQVR